MFFSYLATNNPNQWDFPWDFMVNYGDLMVFNGILW